jgi:hypothetical protein
MIPGWISNVVARGTTDSKYVVGGQHRGVDAGGLDARRGPPVPPGRVVVDEVKLRSVGSSAGAMRFDILVGSTCAGWLELAGPGVVLRLSGEVSEGFRGRGVATAAVGVACRIAYSAMETRVLEAFVPNGLGAAHRVLEANGFSVADLREEPLRFELNRTSWSGSAGR